MKHVPIIVVTGDPDLVREGLVSVLRPLPRVHVKSVPSGRCKDLMADCNGRCIALLKGVRDKADLEVLGDAQRAFPSARVIPILLRESLEPEVWRAHTSTYLRWYVSRQEVLDLLLPLIAAWRPDPAVSKRPRGRPNRPRRPTDKELQGKRTIIHVPRSRPSLTAGDSSVRVVLSR